MLNIVLDIAMIVVAISMGMCLYRVVKGPTMPDRTVALDTIGVNIIALIALFSMKTVSTKYIDVMLVIAILAFVGTISISRFLVRGEIVDRDLD